MPLALTSLLAIAPAAQASYDPLGSGTTRLNLDDQERLRHRLQR